MHPKYNVCASKKTTPTTGRKSTIPRKAFSSKEHVSGGGGGFCNKNAMCVHPRKKQQQRTRQEVHDTKNREGRAKTNKKSGANKKY